MRTIKTTLLLLAVAALGLVFAVSAEASSSQQSSGTEFRRLRDIPVLADERYGQWVGAGNGLAIQYETVCNNPNIPIDGSYQDLPAFHVLVTGEADGGWWNALLAGKDWESYSLEPYYPNGALEFNIKGAFGGENVKINVQDIDFERAEQHKSGVEVSVSSYVSVTTEWQAVSIPMLDLIPGSGGVLLSQMHGVTLNGDGGKPVELWLNNIRWTSSALEPSFPAVKINQLGYTQFAAKYAYVSGFEDELTARPGTPFEVREIGNNRIAYEGELELVSAFDEGASGEYVLSADFSQVTTPGDYYISVAAYRMDDSLPFAISDNLYSELLVDSARYFYLQRQGTVLDQAHAGIFARGVGHPQDQTAQFRSGGDVTIDVSQGWYDAGDYGKYVNAGAITLSDLFWAYELFPEQFSDSQFNIPEGGNGIPDLLDEARWELEFIRKMQDPNTGGFYHMVQPTQSVVPEQATDTRFIEDVRLVSTVTEEEDPIAAIVGCGETIVDGTGIQPTSTSASAVAALAHAAIVFADVDPGYAQELLNAAEFGWQYLTQNANGVASVDGPYADDMDTDDRFWAAGALYRATGNEQYHSFIRDTYLDIRTDYLVEDENSYGLGKTGTIGVWHYFSAENTDPVIHDWFAGQFEIWRDHMVQRNRDTVWQTTLLDEDYYWGSNFVALATPLGLAVPAKLLGTYGDDITHVSQTALNYLLGINPLRLSYISGYGEESVENLHSIIWNNDGLGDIPRGVLAGGPNAYSDPLIYSNFPAKRYIDNPVTWTVNEHTIYWNAALVFNAALINAEVASLSSPMPEPTLAPIEVEVAIAPTPEPAVADALSAEPEPTPFPVEAPAPVQRDGSPLRAAAIVGGIAVFTTLCLVGLVWVFFLRRE